MRFVEAVCHGSLVVSNRKKEELLQELRKQGFKAFPKTTRSTAAAADGEEVWPSSVISFLTDPG